MSAAPHRSVTITGFPARWRTEQAIAFGQQYGAVTMGIEASPGCFILTYPSEEIVESAGARLDGAIVSVYGREYQLRSSILRGVVYTDSESSEESQDLIVDDTHNVLRTLPTRVITPQEIADAVPRPGTTWRESWQGPAEGCGPPLVYLTSACICPRSSITGPWQTNALPGAADSQYTRKDASALMAFPRS